MPTELDLEELKKNFNSEFNNLSFVSERLKALRKEFKKSGDLSCQTDNLSHIVFGNKMTLYRIETASNTGYNEVLKLIYFYYQKGINPMWIIMQDNSNIPKFLEKAPKK